MRGNVCALLTAIAIGIGAGCASTSSPADREVTDLSGNWSVTRPGREPITGQITKIDKSRYRFSKMYNLSGVYEVWKNMLVIKEPMHPNFTDLGWRIEGPDRLVVILAPPVAVVGTDYTGVVAKRR